MSWTPFGRHVPDSNRTPFDHSSYIPQLCPLPVLVAIQKAAGRTTGICSIRYPTYRANNSPLYCQTALTATTAYKGREGNTFIVAVIDGTPVSFMFRPFRTPYSQHERKKDIIRGWFGRGGNQEKRRRIRGVKVIHTLMVAAVDGTPVSFMFRPFRTPYSQHKRKKTI